MNYQEAQMKDQIMERVRAIHCLRTVVRPLLVKGGLLAAALVSVSLLVSVPHVIANILRQPQVLSYFSYLAAAFLHTHAVVQVALAAIALLSVFVAADALKYLRSLMQLRALSSRAA